MLCTGPGAAPEVRLGATTGTRDAVPAAVGDTSARSGGPPHAARAVTTNPAASTAMLRTGVMR